MPNKGMAKNLLLCVDVGHADATVKTDIPLILDELLPRTLGVAGREAAVAKLNSLAKGCVLGALNCMDEPEVLRAALGDTAPLLALGRGEREAKMRYAAAGGFVEVVRACVGSGADVEAADKNGRT